MKANFSNRRPRARAVAVVCMALASTISQSAPGADETFVGVLSLAIEPDVAKEIQLTPTQRESLLKLIERREGDALELALELRGLSAAEQQARLAPFRAESERLGLDILSLQQRAKLAQLRMKRRGLETLAEPAMARQLGLTEQQQAQVQSILEERSERLAAADGDLAKTVRAEAESKLAGVLNSRQRGSWERMTGRPLPQMALVSEPVEVSDPAEEDTATESGTPSEPSSATREAGTPGVETPSPGSETPDRSPTPTEQVTPASPEPPAESPEPADGVAPPASEPSPRQVTEPTSPAESKTPAPEPGAAAAPGEAPSQPESPGEESQPAVEPSPPTEAGESPGEEAPIEPGATPEASVSPVPATEPGLPAEFEEAPAAEREGPVLLQFRFRYQPWEDVLKWLAKEADFSLVVDAYPPGTFNLTDPRQYTPLQALDIINGQLLTKGYRLIRRGKALILVNLEDGISPDLLETITPEDLDERGEFELVRVLFKVEGMTASEAEEEIKSLLGPQGSIVVMPKSGTLLVTETAGRLRTMRSVLQASAEKQEASEGGLKVFQPQFALPEEILTVARQMFGIDLEENATSDGSIRFVLDPTGSKIIVSGTPEKVGQFEEIFELLDKELTADVASEGIGGQPQFVVYDVSPADPESVLAVLQTLLAGRPAVHLALDPKTKNLVALGLPEDHATIRGILAEMQKDPRQFAVIQLRKLDPELAVLMINKMFGGGEKGEDVANAPKLDADLTTSKLVIRGSTGQIAQIRNLLEQMGETTNPDDMEEANRGPVRFNSQLIGQEAQSVLDQLQGIWPAVRANPIRVVTPSEQIPTVRPGFGPGGVQGAPVTPDADAEMLHRLMMPELFEGAPAGSGGSNRPSPAPKAAPRELDVPGPVTPSGETSTPSPLRRTTTLDKSAARLPGAKIWLVAQTTAPPEETTVAPKTNPAAPQAPKTAPLGPQAPKAAPATPPVPKAPAEAEKKSPAPIFVLVGPNGIVYASEDLEALDAFEKMLDTFSDVYGPAGSGSDFTIYYLKHSRAEVMADLLNRIFGVSSGGGGGGGSLLGEMAGAALGDMGGGMLGSLLGMGDEGGLTATGSLEITPDPRLNALVVRANPTDLAKIDQLLRILDQEQNPENIPAMPKPRRIPVQHAQADQIAEIVKESFRDQLVGAGGQQQQQPTPQQFIQMLRGGGRGGRGGRGGSGTTLEDTQKMTVAVDPNSNALIVRAPDPLFEEVRALVTDLDESAAQSDQTMRVVTLKRANSASVQQALAALLGANVQTGRTSTSRPSTASGAQPGVTPSAAPGTASPPDFQQLMQLRMQQMRGGGGPGGSSRSGGSSRFGGRGRGGR